MLTRNRLVIAAVLLGIASLLTAAQADTVKKHHHYRHHIRVIDSRATTGQGGFTGDTFRYRNGAWDATCFNREPWLRNSDACSR
jgi:hypothetical protein